MERAAGAVWATMLEMPDGKDLEYKYVVLTDPEFEQDVDGNRLLELSSSAPEAFTVVDRLDASVRGLATCLDAPQVLDPASASWGTCRFELMVDEAHEYSHASVVGSHPALGAWRPEDGIPLEREPDSNVWAIDAVLPLGEHIIYKFVVWRTVSMHAAAGHHRRLHIPTVDCHPCPPHLKP